MSPLIELKWSVVVDKSGKHLTTSGRFWLHAQCSSVVPERLAFRECFNVYVSFNFTFFSFRVACVIHRSSKQLQFKWVLLVSPTTTDGLMLPWECSLNLVWECVGLTYVNGPCYSNLAQNIDYVLKRWRIYEVRKYVNERQYWTIGISTWCAGSAVRWWYPDLPALSGI